MKKNVAIIGAGAAGCICAVELKRNHPDWAVELFEAGTRPLAKVAVTGGGRCNITNDFEGVRSLSEAYPRGSKLMQRLFYTFNHLSTLEWFGQEGIRFVTQADHCIFPVTQDAMTIVRALCRQLDRQGVLLHLRHRVTAIARTGTGFGLEFADPQLQTACADYLVVTAGGFPKKEQFSLFRNLDLKIEDPVPSLFAFNLEDRAVRTLAGAVVKDVRTSIEGTRFNACGPLLVTDFGMSGPAILKLSSYAARYLSEQSYRFTLNVNWMGGETPEDVRGQLLGLAAGNPMKQVVSVHPDVLSSRLWRLLVYRAGLPDELRWNGVGRKNLNKLIDILLNDKYIVTGKNRFKEEFVTCGGVALSEINPNTLESRKCPGLFFAGEILDVDAITGGFNLQAAWTTGIVAARHVGL